jgi:multidrug efflux pump
MEGKKKTEKVIREFKLTTLSLKNRNTIFLITILLVLFGIIAFNTMPLELFPEVSLPNIFVKTIYPGNSPVDIENLITRPLEKEIHTINGVKDLSSISTQDNSDIFIEFSSGIEIKEALQDVKDAVDKAKSELPNDLQMDPLVMDFDINEFPIININLSGDYSIQELEDYAEYLDDEIENIPEISKVEIKGLNAREIQINVDPYRMEAAKISFQDIEDAIAFENMSISSGEIKIDQTVRSIRTIGEFKSSNEIEDIIVKHEKGNIVYLKDIADVEDDFEDPLTIARLNKKSVVSLQVIKKAGENLINAADKIFLILAQAKQDGILPGNLNITITNDQSDFVRSMVSNLENSIIMGVIFVILVLFFFLGLRNALFVGIAIPMSMFISFVVLNVRGSTVNMMVLFGMVLALGMLVDNAIVVVENIYRFVHKGHTLFEAAKLAVGEIAMPIIASTSTTLAAFFPLVFWKGIMGEFMKHLPITLIIVLTSSLFVSLVIIPVLTIRFFKRNNARKKTVWTKTLKTTGILLGLAILLYLAKINILATLLMIYIVLSLSNKLFLARSAEWFQKSFLTTLEKQYNSLLHISLQGKRPVTILVSTFLIFLLVIGFFTLRQPSVALFPVNEPSFINIMAILPIGSDITATDGFMKDLEQKIYNILEPDIPIVKSVLTTIGQGVVGENEFAVGNTPQRGMTTIHFVDFEDRQGKLTSDIMKELSRQILGQYPGVKISIEKNQMGPPTGRPINLEVSGKNFPRLLTLTSDIQRAIEAENIKGIEGLQIDLDVGLPELLIEINRDKARRFGLSTAQIASNLRTALFGKEISDFKEGEDEYPIMLRIKKRYRNSIAALMNLKITFRDPSSGRILQIPISSVANFKNSSTYGAVRRKNLDKVVTLYSNIIEGYNAQQINARLKALMRNYSLPEGYQYRFTGEQEDQAESTSFLTQALLMALALILIILVTQFNSFAKPLIIMASVLFSTIGVFLGIAIFRMDFVIIMTGIGIISLAGVVVNNAIVLIDYIDYLKRNRRKQLGLDLDDDLPLEHSIACIIQAGKTRLRPVLLTAITTILGLTPLAVGLNINFSTLLSHLNPQIYFGGDNALFWGPMAWTVIFGLTFATFLTLILVPVMYLIGNRMKLNFKKRGLRAGKA